MRLMARTATGYPVALGFRGQLATGHDGDPPGRLDLKRGAIIPLVNLVRFHALANGVTISPTVDRIEAVASVGGLERADADALREAFVVITAFASSITPRRCRPGSPPDNLVDPEELAPIARSDLREALHVVRRAQKRVGAWSPPIEGVRSGPSGCGICPWRTLRTRKGVEPATTFTGESVPVGAIGPAMPRL